MSDDYNEENDFGYQLSIMSIEAYEKGDYILAFFYQVEIFENTMTPMIAGRARHLGKDEKEVKRLAYKGNFDTKINNFIEISGEEFRSIWKDLHNYRKRRNKIIHKKSEFKNEAELKRFSKESWELGTNILFCFINSIENYPNGEQ